MLENYKEYLYIDLNCGIGWNIVNCANFLIYVRKSQLLGNIHGKDHSNDQGDKEEENNDYKIIWKVVDYTEKS